MDKSEWHRDGDDFPLIDHVHDGRDRNLRSLFVLRL
jgi:hypothetical protein